MTNAIKVLLQRQSGFLQLENLTHVGAIGPKYALKSNKFFVLKFYLGILWNKTFSHRGITFKN
jgi:hypothetical protein